ncbi:MAG: hypothetical protein Kapaf2KO_22150 [Candidatus Kapaibacteriales bacterium]
MVNPDEIKAEQIKIKNFWYMLKRFESDEVKDHEIILDCGDSRQYSTRTDSEGYFLFEIDKSLEEGTHEFLLRTENMFEGEKKQVTSNAKVIVPNPEAEYGVISDIDDTILKSFIPTPFKMLKTLLTSSASSRKSFEGTGEFYQKLVHNSAGKRRPFFFVSGSPWNIYDVLIHFIEDNNFPTATLFLKDLGITDTYIFSESTKKHKLRWIKEILEFYPNQKFIVIGDSGQEDAEIYSEASEKFPERIDTIYIRDVSDGINNEKFAVLTEKLKANNIEFMTFKESTEAKNHASSKSFI